MTKRDVISTRQSLQGSLIVWTDCDRGVVNLGTSISRSVLLTGRFSGKQVWGNDGCSITSSSVAF